MPAAGTGDEPCRRRLFPSVCSRRFQVRSNAFRAAQGQRRPPGFSPAERCWARSASWETARQVGDNWLVICFLGVPVTSPALLPRVGAWDADAPPEDVQLSPQSRRMIAHLVVPPLRFSVTASKRGAAEAFAGSLAQPLPRRSTTAVRRALGLTRTTEFRYRNELVRELEAAGLDAHVATGRGWIEPHRVTTDVAQLVQLVRDEDWPAASRLLDVVSEGQPEQVQWLSTDDWPEQTHEHVRDAIALAKAHLREDPDRTSVAAEAAASEGRIRPAEDEPRREAGGRDLVPTRGGQLVVAEVALPWRQRPVDLRSPRRRRRRLRSMLAAGLIAVAASVSAWALLDRDADVLQLEWPQDQRELAYIANLSKDLPLSSPVVSTPDDELVLRARIPRDARLRRDLSVELDVYASTGRETKLGLTLKGGGARHYEDVFIRTGTPALRPRLLSGTTALRAADGTLIRHLPDARAGHAVDMGRVEAVGDVFLDTRLAVRRVTRIDPGQVAAGQHFECTKPDEEDLSSDEVPYGETLTCEAYLVNWGPKTLETLIAAFDSDEIDKDGSASIRFWTSSAQASPRYQWHVDTNEVLGARTGVTYLVDGSLRVLRAGSDTSDPDRQAVTPPGDFSQGVDLGELAPGRSNALELRFEVVIY